MSRPGPIRTAAVVLPGGELDATVAFFTDRLGFRLDAIMPADDPAIAELSGHGTRLRLVRGAPGDAGVVRLEGHFGGNGPGPGVLTAPNGTRVELVAADQPVQLPPPEPQFELTRSPGGAAGEGHVAGRAGMRYRDLLPARQGGRFIASHIVIDAGGPVPDHVHHHRLRFQVIYCVAGWVRVVYEDQGPPFVLRPGDCVLQPPGIRHRVLESSPGLEVVEVGSPAVHETRIDHELALPTPTRRPGRRFDGQRFVFHRSAGATWTPWRQAGFVARDTGIADATAGLAGVVVVRPAGRPPEQWCAHDGELQLWYVLDGSTTLLTVDRGAALLGGGDAVAVPAGVAHALTACSPDLELLEITLPAR